MALHAHRGVIAADTTKRSQPSLTPKDTRNLRLDFDHTQVPLSLIVSIIEEIIELRKSEMVMIWLRQGYDFILEVKFC
jgi:hypothetical protein